MNWLILIAISNYSALFIYRYRYTSKIRIMGLYLVEFYQLLIATPLTFVALINLGLDILGRDTLGLNLFPDRVLFSLFAFSLASCLIGVGIHASSTSVYQSFRPNLNIKAYLQNEIFHGPFSHDMAYIGGVFTVFFLFLFELNHPSGDYFSLSFLILLGLVIGVPLAISNILSTHVVLVFISSLACSIASLMTVLTFNIPLSNQPVAVVSFVALASFTLTLFIALLVYTTSKSLMKQLIKRLFPKGHPVHEEFSVI